MPLRSDYIDLDRVLIGWDENYDPEQAALYTYFAKHHGGSSWQDALEHDRIVVLGEAGSGKTWELEARAEILKQKNKPAFFVRVEHITSSGLQGALLSPDDQNFLAWLNSSDEVGYFFLDATDECRITSHHALEQALRNFANQLSSAVKRAKIILSCRASEWQPKTDPDLIRTIFPLTKEKVRAYEDKKQPLLKIVLLAPLDRSQVTKIAQIKIPATASRFIDTIADQELWHFVGRPSDALNMIRYWETNSRIGALHEIIEADITYKLKDANPRRLYPLLPEEKARQGAMLLAATTQICRTFTFSLPDQNPDFGAATLVVNPRTILPDWLPADVDSLLSCALFDEAAYGRIRFHHRSIAEYLAAQWLNQQIEKGCPQRAIAQIFFRESHGQTVLVPSLAPVAAWLAAKHPFIRRRIIEISPETLIHFGDPSLLPVDNRKTALKQLAKRSRVQIGFGNFAQIKRLAIPALAPLINSLLVDSATTPDAKQSLLLIAGQGQLQECSATVLAIASDPSADEILIQYAIHALGAIGSQTHLRTFYDTVLARDELSPKITAELCRAAYPQTLTEDNLKSLVFKTSFPAQNHASTFAINLGAIIDEELPDDRLATLIKILTDIAQSEPHSAERQFGQFENLSLDYTWIFDPLSKAVGKALALNSRANISVQDLTTAIRTLESIRAVDHYYGSNNELAKLLQQCRTEIRRTLFWREVASQRDSRSPDHLLVPAHYDMWSILPADIEWLMEDATTKESENDRLFAYRNVLTYWLQNRRPLELEENIKKISKSSLAHRKLYNDWVNNKIRRAFFWFKNSLMVRIRHTHWKALLRRWMQDKHWKIKTIIYALIHPAWIREGTSFGLLYNFYVFADGNGRAEHKLGKYNRNNLEKNVGRRLAELARGGFKAYWKLWAPPLPLQELRSKSYHGTTIAMLGLTADFEDGLNWSMLPDDAATKAAQHSLREFNRVLTWLDRLTEAKPTIVRQIYREQLEAEFTVSSDTQFTSGLMSDLASGDRFIRELCAPDVQELLSNGEPLHLHILQYVLRILTEQNSVEFLKRIVPERTLRARLSGDLKRFSTWLSIWLQVDCPAALDFLDAQEWSTPDEIYDVVLSICDNMYAHFSASPQVANPSYLNIQNLARFLGLLYTHVDPLEDQYHEGVHSPDSRDNAQHFRGTVLKHLIETPPETNAYTAMIEFANSLPEGDEKQIMLDRAKERARIEADRRWEQSRLVTFSKKHEAPPSNTDELFAVVLDRLDDIKDNLENGDFSPRNDFAVNDHEGIIQREIAKLLDLMRRDSYEAVREAQVIDDNKTDIRIIRQTLNPVTIEVKWAHKWSYNNHVEAIRDQLVGQYMRSHNSQHGVYLMVNYDRSKQWRPDGEPLIGFDQLITRMQTYADGLVAGRGAGEKITVVGIELSP